MLDNFATKSMFASAITICSVLVVSYNTASAAQKMKVLIGDKLQTPAQFMTENGLNGKPPQDIDKALRKAFCKGADCSDETKYPPLKGFSRLFKATGKGSWKQMGVGKTPGKGKWIAECDEARMAKIGFHEVFSGEVPDTFGKIINWAMVGTGDDGTGAKRPKWTGVVEVCTWIGDDEYYFKLIINKLILHTKGDATDPFPNTLPLPSDSAAKQAMLDMMNQWKYKLHARGDDITIVKAIKNKSQNLLTGTDPLESDVTNCFDLFLNEIELGREPKPTDPLPAQQHYCMGRCDARILNTM